MDCYDKIYGNDYYDFIVRNNEYLPPVGEAVCTLDGGENYTILFASSEVYPPLSVANYSYNAIPNCYMPLSIEALDAAGILQVRQSPTLALDGKGVLVGFLDSGIDAFHPAFLDEAGNSRVVAVWNQNYMEEMDEAQNPQENYDSIVPYGRVYGTEDMESYGNRDMTGHGTYVASVAAGSVSNGHSGAAPGADIAMVQLKDAKRYLKDYYYIPEDTVCYEETDLIMGIKFLDDLAKLRGQSLVICMSVGCALGSHSGNSPLDLYLDNLAVAFRRCIVAATGNMAASRRHFYGTLRDDSYEVEVVVEDNTCGFVMELWAVAPVQFRVVLVSPAGEILPSASIQISGSQEYEFALEGTIVSVDYSQPEATTGNQLIYFRFQKPVPGIWRIRVLPVNNIRGNFHMYLAPRELQCGEVYFLASNPDTTIVDPGNALRVITVGGYQQTQNAILLESGRGYTIEGALKPDIAAPAFLVEGALAGAPDIEGVRNYEGRTGTSGAVAITAGAAAMYMQWCDLRGDYLVNTTQTKIFFIRGAKRLPDELYPNRQWGYGTLSLYDSFRQT